LYYSYQNCISTYQEDKEKGKFPNKTLVYSDDETAEIIKEKVIPIFKPENIGNKMNIDDKSISHDTHTILSNTDTGKIAMMIESIKGEELKKAMSLFDKKTLQKIEHISSDMSPTYLNLCQEELPNAELSIDKFHVIINAYDVVLDVRSATKRRLSKGLTKGKKKTDKDHQKLHQIELLNRCRHRLTQSPDKWSDTTKEMMEQIFKKHKKLKTAYNLSQDLKNWYDINNYNYKDRENKIKIKEALYNWYDKVKKSKITQFNAVVKMIKKHETFILNYFTCGHNNAKAENLNSKIQRFVSANFGLRNKDFSIYRIAGYLLSTSN
jgi:transposase